MNRKINKNFLIIGAMILATVLAFLLISIFSKNDPRINPGVVTESNLRDEILQLESNLLELELVFSEKDIQVDNFETLLDEKYVQLDNMDKKVDALEAKIDQLEREGKVDKSTIREMREKLANAKGQMVKNLKGEINLLVRDLGSLTRAGDSLTLLSQELQKSVEDCNANANAVASTMTSPAPSIDTNVPVTPVADARKEGFYAESIIPKAFTKDNKSAMKRKGPNVDSKKANILQVNCTLVGVGAVPRGTQNLYLVIDKGGEVLSNNVDNSQSGKTIIVKGSPLQFTASTKPNYQGSTQNVTFKYVIGKGKTIKGQYTIKIYWKSPKGTFLEITETETKFMAI